MIGPYPTPAIPASHGDDQHAGTPLDVGFFRSAFRAMHGPHGVVFWSVIEDSWCRAWLARRDGLEPPHPAPARLDLSDLAAETGIRRSDLERSLAELVDVGMLVRRSDGAFTVDLRSKALKRAPFGGLVVRALGGRISNSI